MSAGVDVPFAPPRPLEVGAWQAPGSVQGLAQKALWVGVVGILVTFAGYFIDRAQFFQSYLLGWVYCVSIAAGCLGLLMLHHMSRGAWGLPARRIFEAGSRTLLPLLLLGLPLALGMNELYSWSRPDVVAGNDILEAKKLWLSVPFFWGRYAFYFAVWIVLARALSKLSVEQDGGGQVSRRMQVWSGPGLVIFALTLTFAAFDWLMSLMPEWFSTIYGVWFLVSSGLAGLAFLILIARWLSQQEPMSSAFHLGHFHDYGKLLLAFTMLWAYMSFSQFLIIWSANLPPEIPFYLARSKQGWQFISALVFLGQFALPFILLLSRDIKRRPAQLIKVALWILAIRWVDLYWNIAPAFHPERPLPHWLDLAALVGVGGIWVALFARELASRPLLPVNAPNLAEALGHE